MMLRCIMACVLCLLTGVLPLTAQDSLLYKRFTIPQSKCTVEEAISIIEKQTGFSFSYNSGLIQKKEVISLAADDKPLFDILTGLFRDPSLSFSIIGRHLVIYRPVKTSSIDPENKTDSVYYFTVTGKVLDITTRQPIPFSSVYLVGRTKGTISNDDGEFQLKLSSSDLSETLSISSIGYKNFKAQVSTLVNTTNNYFLEADVVPIQEVIIRKMSPVMLLQSAVNKINNNYPSNPAVLTSFYRETIRRGNHYSMVSEAVLENYKSGYRSLVPDQIKIIKGRKNEAFNHGDSVMLKLKAGLNTMLMLDVVKNVPDFLTGRNLDDYIYRLSDIVTEDGVDNYAIEFEPKAGSPEGAIYSGRILLDIRDMAFRWIEFKVNPAQLDQATDQFIIRKPSNLVVRALKASYKVSFRKSGNKFYLQMVRCETEFKIRNRRQLAGSIYNTRLEMAVTGIDTVNVNRFPQRETARVREFFTAQVGQYDEAFWGEYNFIKPDESLENAIAKLSRAMNRKQQ